MNASHSVTLKSSAPDSPAFGMDAAVQNLTRPAGWADHLPTFAWLWRQRRAFFHWLGRCCIKQAKRVVTEAIVPLALALAIAAYALGYVHAYAEIRQDCSYQQWFEFPYTQDYQSCWWDTDFLMTDTQDFATEYNL